MIRVWETEGLYFWLDARSNRGICGIERWHFPGIGDSLSFFYTFFPNSTVYLGLRDD